VDLYANEDIVFSGDLRKSAFPVKTGGETKALEDPVSSGTSLCWVDLRTVVESLSFLSV